MWSDDGQLWEKRQARIPQTTQNQDNRTAWNIPRLVCSTHDHLWVQLDYWIANRLTCWMSNLWCSWWISPKNEPKTSLQSGKLWSAATKASLQHRTEQNRDKSDQEWVKWSDLFLTQWTRTTTSKQELYDMVIHKLTDPKLQAWQSKKKSSTNEDMGTLIDEY